MYNSPNFLIENDVFSKKALKKQRKQWYRTLIFRVYAFTIVFLLVIVAGGYLSAVDENTAEELIDNEYQGGGIAQDWHGDDDQWEYTLHFAFNFYGVDYTEIMIGSNGILCFGSGVDCTSYEASLDDSFGPFIAPLATDLKTDLNPTNDIYITENNDNVVIRWDVVEYGETDQIYFEVVLYENGNIKFNYGDQDLPALAYNAIVGISKGDGIEYTASVYNNTDSFDLVQTSAWGVFEPDIISVYPEDDEYNVPIDTNLIITFDREIYPGDGSINIVKAQDDAIAEEVEVNSQQIIGWGTDTIEIDIVNELLASTIYYIQIDDGAIIDENDLSYPGFTDKNIWNFTTLASEISYDFSEDFTNLDYIDSTITNSYYNPLEKSFEIPEDFRSIDGLSGDPFSYEDFFAGYWMTADIDQNNNIYSVWVGTIAGTELHFSRWNGSEWTQMNGAAGYESLFSGSGLNDIAVYASPNNYPVVTWKIHSGLDQDLYVAVWNNDQWNIKEFSLTNNSVSRAELKFDSSGLPVVAWEENLIGLNISRWNGSEWTQMDGSTTPSYETISVDGFDPSMAIDVDNNIYIAWDESGTTDILFSKWNGSEWTQIDGSTEPSFQNIADTTQPSEPIVFLLDNKPAVLYNEYISNSRSDLRLIRWNGSEWTQMDGSTLGSEIISSPTGKVEYPEVSHDRYIPGIVIKPDGYPIITWEDNNLNLNVLLTQWNGLEWTQMNGAQGYENVSNSSGSGFSHLGIDKNGFPIVSWWDGNSFDGLEANIVVSRWDGTQWNNEAVGKSRYYHSLLFDSEDSEILIWNRGNSLSFEMTKRFTNTTVQSNKINGLLEGVLRATVIASSTIPGNSKIEYYLSNDGGITWVEVESGEEHIFDSAGDDLRWKAILYEGSSPILSGVTINYSNQLPPAPPAPPAPTNQVGSGGLPDEAFDSPEPPAEEESDFQVIINNDDKTTNSRDVELELISGEDTADMAISNDSNFEGINLVPYKRKYDWTLSKGEGKKTVYAKFFTRWGRSTDVVSDSIIYSPEHDIEEEVQTQEEQDENEGDTFEQDQEIEEFEIIPGCIINEESRVISRGQVSEVVDNINTHQNIEKEQKAENELFTKIVDRLGDVLSDVKQKIIYFIAYGDKGNRRLGPGERAGVIDSYNSAYNKYPVNYYEWNDVIKIGRGEMPCDRDIKAEQRALKTFIEVYKRLPDHNKSNEEKAMNMVAYGLRPEKRDLEKESEAILKYREIYKYFPETAYDWNIIRAIAYSGVE